MSEVLLYIYKVIVVSVFPCDCNSNLNVSSEDCSIYWQLEHLESSKHFSIHALSLRSSPHLTNVSSSRTGRTNNSGKKKKQTPLGELNMNSMRVRSVSEKSRDHLY